MSHAVFSIGFGLALLTNVLLFAAIARLRHLQRPSTAWEFLVNPLVLWKSARGILTWAVDGGDDRIARLLIVGFRVSFVATILAAIGFQLTVL